MPHYPSHTDVGNNTVTIQNQPFSNPNPANMNAPSVINNNFGLRNSSYGITNNPMAQTQQTGTVNVEMRNQKKRIVEVKLVF